MTVRVMKEITKNRHKLKHLSLCVITALTAQTTFIQQANAEEAKSFWAPPRPKTFRNHWLNNKATQNAIRNIIDFLFASASHKNTRL